MLAGLKMTQLPYILTLAFKRFDYDFASDTRKKINSEVKFPFVLDMNRWCDAPWEPQWHHTDVVDIAAITCAAVIEDFQMIVRGLRIYARRLGGGGWSRDLVVNCQFSLTTVTTTTTTTLPRWPTYGTQLLLARIHAAVPWKCPIPFF